MSSDTATNLAAREAARDLPTTGETAFRESIVRKLGTPFADAIDDVQFSGIKHFGYSQRIGPLASKSSLTNKLSRPPG